MSTYVEEARWRMQDAERTAMYDLGVIATGRTVGKISLAGHDDDNDDDTKY